MRSDWNGRRVVSNFEFKGQCVLLWEGEGRTDGMNPFNPKTIGARSLAAGCLDAAKPTSTSNRTRENGEQADE